MRPETHRAVIEKLTGYKETDVKFHVFLGKTTKLQILEFMNISERIKNKESSQMMVRERTTYQGKAGTRDTKQQQNTLCGEHS